MIKKIFIRNSDNNLRFIWKFTLIIGAGLIIGKIFGAVLGYILLMYFAATRGKVISIEILQENPIVNGFTLITEQAVMILVIMFFIYKFDKKSLEQVGVKLNKNAGKEFGFGCILGIAGMGLTALIFIALDTAFVNSTGVKLVREISYTGIKDISSAAAIIYVMVLFMLVAFQEELLCRGYMISYLSSQNPVIAVIIPSAVFSLMHIRNPEFSLLDKRKAIITGIALFNIFLIGVILGAYFWASKNLWLAIGTHFTWNFIQGPILGFNVSGIETGSIANIFLTLNRNYAVLTGGKIGPEGGIVVTMALVFMAAVLYLYYKLTNCKNNRRSSSIKEIAQ